MNLPNNDKAKMLMISVPMARDLAAELQATAAALLNASKAVEESNLEDAYHWVHSKVGSFRISKDGN